MLAYFISFCAQILVAIMGCFVTALYTVRTINIVPIYKVICNRESTEKNLHALKKCREDLFCSTGTIIIGLIIVAIAFVGDTTAFFTELLY